MKKYIQIGLALSFYFVCLVNTPLWAQPVLTATGTPGTCEADCKITVSASGGTGTVKYALIVPSQQPRGLQESTLFEGLPPGDYTVAVYDNTTGNSNPVTKPITLTTPYLTVQIGSITKVEPTTSCGMGSITVSATNGKVPFTYSYIATIGGEVITETSAPTSATSYTFTGLSRGANYAIKVVDACNADAPGSITFTGATYAPLIVTPPTEVILSYEEYTLRAGTACTDYHIGFRYNDTEPVFLEHPTIHATKYRVEYPAGSGNGTPWSANSKQYHISNFDASNKNKRTFRFQMENPCTGEIISSKIYNIPWKVAISIGEDCNDVPFLISSSLSTNGFGGNLFDACPATITAINTTTGIPVAAITRPNLSTNSFLPDLRRGETYQVNVKQGPFDTTFVYTVPRYFHDYRIWINSREGLPSYYCGYDYQVEDLRTCTDHYPVRLTIAKRSDGVVIQDFNYSSNTSHLIANLDPNTYYTFTITDGGGTTEVINYLTQSEENFRKVALYGKQNFLGNFHNDFLENLCSLNTGHIGSIQYPGTTVKYKIIDGPDQVGTSLTRITAPGPSSPLDPKENILLWQNLSFGTYKVEVDYSPCSLKDTITITLDKRYTELGVDAILYMGNTCSTTHVKGRPYAIDKFGDRQYLDMGYTAILKSGNTILAQQTHSSMRTQYNFTNNLTVNQLHTIEIELKHRNGKTGLCIQKEFQFEPYVPLIINKAESGGVICSGNVGDLKITQQQGSGPFTYQYKKSTEGDNYWKPAIPQSDSVFTNMPLGTYDIRIIDRCGAKVEEEVKVFNPTVQSVIKATGVHDHVGNTAKTCPGTKVVLSIDLVGAISNVVWTNPAGISMATNDLTINNFQPGGVGVGDEGKYKVTFRTALGSCEATSDLTITAGRAIASHINVPPPATACNNGSTTLQVSGNNVPGTLLFRWYSDINLTTLINTGPNYNTPVLTVSTEYYVTLQSENLCENVPGTAAIVKVDIKPLPTILIDGLSPICAGTSTKLLASGADTYRWSTGETTAEITVTPSANQIYTVTGKLGGCESTASFTMTVKPIPNLIVNGATSVCLNDAVTLTIPPELGAIYTWSHDPLASTSVSEVLTESKVYKVTALGTNGCETKKEIPVTVRDLPVVNILANANSCIGAPYTLTASGASAYRWNTGAITASITTAPIVNTIYSVVGKDGSGCESLPQTHGVIMLPLPTVAIATALPSVCIGGTTTLTATGATQYVWDHNKTGGLIIETPNATTSYTVTGTDANGCKANATQNIIVNPLPDVTINASKDVICKGESVQLDALGATNYLWNTSPIETAQSITVSPLATKTYSLTGTDGNGCKATATKQITVNALPNFVITGPTVICENEVLTLNVTGSNTYVWDGGVTGLSFTETPTVGTHTYSVEGTDAFGCTFTKTHTVVVNPLPVVSFVTPTDEVCKGGSVNLQVAGASDYLWSGGQTGTAITDSPNITTTYTVEGTSNKGCKATAVHTLIVNPLPTLILTAANDICLGQSLNLSVVGANDYEWSATNANISSINVMPSANTNYWVIGTDGKGCKNKATHTVTVHATPAITIAAKPAICKGDNLNLVASSTSATNFVWQNGLGNVASINDTPLADKIYTVEGTDAFGCMNTATHNVVVNSLPTVSFVNPTDEVCKGSNVSLQVTGAAQYVWNNGPEGGNTLTEAPTANKTYTVEGTDTKGCKATVVHNLTVNLLPTLTLTAASDVCYGLPLTLSVTGAGAGSYEWNTNASSSSIIDHPITDQSYWVIGTDINGCKSRKDHSVTVRALPVITIAGKTAICKGDNLNLVASGATSFIWTGGGNTPNINEIPLANKTYTVEGADAFGCIGNATHNVVVNNLPTVSFVNPTDEVCKGGSVSLQVSGAAQYLWSGGLGAGNAITEIPIANKTYTVEGTDANGCKATAAHNLVVNPLPTLILTAANDICLGQSLNLSVVGANTYEWSGPIANTSSINDSPTANKDYWVIGTDGKGCKNKATHTVTVHALPVITIAAKPAICLGDNLNLLAGGATSFVWQNGLGNVASINDTPLANKIYTVEGTDAFGCIGTANHNVVVNSLPVVTFVNPPIEACSGSNVNLKVTGATQYIWDNGQPGTAIADMPTANKTYTVEGTDANGCKATASHNLAVNPLPILTLTGADDICFGFPVNLSIAGADTYLWNTDVTLDHITDSPINDKDYWVIGTDIKGCQSKKSHKVTVHAQPVIQITAKTAICKNDNLNLLASGATSFVWEGGMNGASIDVTPLANETYTVEGTDAFGCIGTKTHSVVVHGLPTLTIEAIGETCSGTNVSLQVSGAKQYVWDNGKTGSFITDIPINDMTYIVEGTDKNGCKATKSHQLTVNPLPTLTITALDAICVGDAIDLSVNGADKYLWSTGLTTTTITESPKNDIMYSVVGEDVNGCKNTQTHPVIVHKLPKLVLQAPKAICLGTDAVFHISGASEYLWQDGQVGADIVDSPSNDKMYSIEGTDINGCKSTIIHNLKINTLPIVRIAALDKLCKGDKITLQASGAIQYAWQDGKQGSLVVDIPSIDKIYSVEGVDNNGCKALAQHAVIVNPLPELKINALDALCKGHTITLNVIGADTYKWTTGETTASISDIPLHDRTYAVYGTDTNKCVSLQTHKLRIKPLPDARIAAVNNLCYGDTTNLLGTGGDTYTWNTGEVTASITVQPLHDSIYNLTVGLEGCEVSTSHRLAVHALPKISIAGDTAVCKGEDILLKSSTLGLLDHAWYFRNNEINQGPFIKFIPDETGNYEVRAKDVRGCIGKELHFVEVLQPAHIEILGDSVVCQGNQLILEAMGGETYTWNTGHIGDSLVIYPIAHEVYSLIANDINNCKITKSIAVDVSPYPKANMTISTHRVNEKYPSVDFSSTNTETDFVWNMGDGYYGTSKDFTYAFNTDYLKDYKVSLIVKNQYACPDTVHRIISVDKYVANTFTPNGDGLNDIFMEQCDECRKIQIFDRLGVLLHDNTEGWDGMYKGQFVGNDTYFYVITVEREDKTTEDLKGYVTIIGKK